MYYVIACSETKNFFRYFKYPRYAYFSNNIDNINRLSMERAKEIVELLNYSPATFTIVPEANIELFLRSIA